MKKILGIVAGIVGIISVIVGVALKMNNNAIAIIGGADGPTSVFATRSHFPLFIIKAIRKRVSRAVIDRSVYP